MFVLYFFASKFESNNFSDQHLSYSNVSFFEENLTSGDKNQQKISSKICSKTAAMKSKGKRTKKDQTWRKQLKIRNKKRAEHKDLLEEYAKTSAENEGEGEQTKNAHRVKEKIKSLIVFDIDELC